MKRLGGFVERDEKAPDKPVIGVSLRGTKVTASVLEQLKAFNNLRSLDLSNTKFTNAKLKYLRALTGLQNLDLSGTKVSSSGLEQLEGLKKLQSLDVRRTRVVSVKDFERAVPNCRVLISK